MIALRVHRKGPVTYSADTSSDVQIIDSAGDRIREQEIRRPALCSFKAKGNGSFTLTLRNTTSAADVVELNAGEDGEVCVEDLSAHNMASWPGVGEKLGFKLVLGSASKVTIEWVAGVL